MKFITQQEFATMLPISDIRRVFLVGQQSTLLFSILFLTENGEQWIISEAESARARFFDYQNALVLFSEMGCFNGGMDEAVLDLSRAHPDNTRVTQHESEISFKELAMRYTAIKNTPHEYEQLTKDIPKWDEEDEKNEPSYSGSASEKTGWQIKYADLSKLSIACLAVGVIFIFFANRQAYSEKMTHLIQITLMGMMTVAILALVFTLFEKFDPDFSARQKKYFIWLCALAFSITSTCSYVLSQIFAA